MRIIAPMIHLINAAFQHVMHTCKIYNIDESHALKHSMEVYGFAKKIYESELKQHPYLEQQQEIIFMAAIGHDMCDKKYMDEKEGIQQYIKILEDNKMQSSDINIVCQIIETMSYSKVKINGFPDLGNYTLAYHIVREADLLAAYDIDRCVIYTMYKNEMNYDTAFIEALKLFDVRVFKMKSDKLFKTKYAKKESLKLHKKAKMDVESLKSIFKYF
jgi:HD superfamily phosphodiesterase